MNLLLARSEERQGERLVIRGPRAAHLRKVVGVSLGSELRVGLVGESVGQARVLELGEEEVVLGELRLVDPGPAPRLRLILALPRPKVLRRMLQTLASFGVAHIDLVNAWRVEKSYWSSPVLEEGRLVDELWLGCEQGRHPWLPSIACHRLLVPYLRDFDALGHRCLLAQPGASRWLDQLGPLDASTTLAIGPEGGWIESERRSFAERGFLEVTISERILRSEVALAAALAQWELSARGPGRPLG